MRRLTAITACRVQHPELAPALGPPHAAPAPAPQAARAPPAAKRKRQEQFAWDAAALGSAGGDELCFEEVWLLHALCGEDPWRDAAVPSSVWMATPRSLQAGFLYPVKGAVGRHALCLPWDCGSTGQ